MLPIILPGLGLGKVGDSILADSGTEQLEFIALSREDWRPQKYQMKVEKVIAELNRTSLHRWFSSPFYINPHRGTASYSVITLIAMGDRFDINSLLLTSFYSKT
ncbi:hypothetical protein RJ641_000029 [Dillenia turbinata]|uniref:Uncharacterized protein n=1 Tax=Dillenia turbinata TaxID=194707 RepID=A0AAN8YQ65_9MAGN